MREGVFKAQELLVWKERRLLGEKLGSLRGFRGLRRQAGERGPRKVPRLSAQLFPTAHAQMGRSAFHLLCLSDPRFGPLDTTPQSRETGSGAGAQTPHVSVSAPPLTPAWCGGAHSSASRSPVTRLRILSRVGRAECPVPAPQVTAERGVVDGLSEQGAEVTHAWPPSDRTEILRGEEPPPNHQQPPQPSPAPRSARSCPCTPPCPRPAATWLTRCVAARVPAVPGLSRAWASQPHLHSREWTPREGGRELQGLPPRERGPHTDCRPGGLRAPRRRSRAPLGRRGRGSPLSALSPAATATLNTTSPAEVPSLGLGGRTRAGPPKR